MFLFVGHDGWGYWSERPLSKQETKLAFDRRCVNCLGQAQADGTRWEGMPRYVCQCGASTYLGNLAAGPVRSGVYVDALDLAYPDLALLPREDV